MMRKKTRGSPLVNSDLDQSGARDEPQQPFVFKTRCSSSAESEVKSCRVNQHGGEKTFKDEKLTNESLKCLEQNSANECQKLRKKIVKTLHTL